MPRPLALLGLAALGCAPTAPAPAAPESIASASGAGPAAPDGCGPEGPPITPHHEAFDGQRCLVIGPGADGAFAGVAPADAGPTDAEPAETEAARTVPSLGERVPAKLSLSSTMSSDFMLRGMALAVDGRVIAWRNAAPEGEPSELAPPELAEPVELAPGEHELAAFVALRNRPLPCGYCYQRSFCIQVASTRRITVRPGAPLAVRAVAFERGGITTPVEERPSIRWSCAPP